MKYRYIKVCAFCNKILKLKNSWFCVNDKIYCCEEGRLVALEKLKIKMYYESKIYYA
jgi:hypothetical protein